MVRLKDFKNLENFINFFKFQFLMVRLKVSLEMGQIIGIIKFQFLMVRLKGETII